MSLKADHTSIHHFWQRWEWKTSKATRHWWWTQRARGGSISSTTTSQGWLDRSSMDMQECTAVAVWTETESSIKYIFRRARYLVSCRVMCFWLKERVLSRKFRSTWQFCSLPGSSVRRVLRSSRKFRYSSRLRATQYWTWIYPISTFCRNTNFWEMPTFELDFLSSKHHHQTKAFFRAITAVLVSQARAYTLARCRCRRGQMYS